MKKRYFYEFAASKCDITCPDVTQWENIPEPERPLQTRPLPYVIREVTEITTDDGETVRRKKPVAYAFDHDFARRLASILTEAVTIEIDDK